MSQKPTLSKTIGSGQTTSPAAVMSRLWPYIRPLIGIVALGLIAMGFVAASEAGIPMLLKPLLDQRWAFLVYAGLWWEPLRTDLDSYMEAANALVSGRIGIKLFKGSARVTTRFSPHAVYDAQMATFSESGGLFAQAASPGFIELWSLQSRMAWRVRARD